MNVPKPETKDVLGYAVGSPEYRMPTVYLCKRLMVKA